MRLQKAPLLAATATVFLLAACGGGGGPTVLGPGRTVVPSASDVFALSNTTADTTSRIGGVTLASLGNTVQIVTANLPHQTGRIEGFDNGLTNVASLDPDGLGGWSTINSSGTNDVLTLSDESIASLIYSGIFNFTAVDTDASGATIIGVLTPSSGFPSGGTITYVGSGFVDGITASTAATFAARGVSEITSNFSGAGSVGVEISAFDNAGLPFDRIVISSMVLSKSTAAFALPEDGTVTLFAGNTDVTARVLGASHDTDAAGAFFGLDSREEDFQPREVGGVFVGDSTVAGTTGTLSGGFIANNTRN